MNQFPGSLVFFGGIPSLIRLGPKARIAALCVLGCIAGIGSTALAQTATTTTLAITTGGSAATTVPMGTVVTLTATVTAGTTPVSPGQVKFCDATAAHCEDIHIIGTAQLTSSGAALVKFRPGIGSHSYNAVFLGTPNGSSARAGSTSSIAALTVTAPAQYPSTTVMTVSGSTGAYQLGATVSGIGAAPPTGTVSFLDTSNGNAVLGTASLSSATSSFGLANVSYPVTGPGPVAIAVADFNLDGTQDIAIANVGSGLGNDTLTILLGKGDGTFNTAPSPATGVIPQAVVAGDFNGDGIPDLAVGNDGNLTILLGNGDGTFTSAASPTVGDSFLVSALAVGDLNGDGNLDLAVLSGSGAALVILLGHGDGTFTEANGSPIRPVNNPPNSFLWSLNALAVADFNGDGKLDIATADSDMCDINCGGTQFLTIFLGNGDGTFAASAIITPVNEYVNEDPISIAAADLNGDGIPDLAVSASDGLNVLLGNGDGTFTPLTPEDLGDGPGYIGPGYIGVGNFNGDGIADLVMTFGTDPSQDYGVLMLSGKGDGTFTSQTFQAATNSLNPQGFLAGIAVGDFNGDGLQDVSAPDYANNTAMVLLSQTQFDVAPPQTAVVLNGVGTHLVEASYPGDTNYGASTSATAALNLSPGPPTVSLTLSANTVNYGTPVTATSVVSGSGPTPTGTVTFIFTGQPGPQQPESENCVATLNSNGVAGCTTTPRLLSGGTYSVVASYSGDSSYPSTDSSPVILSVFNQSTPIITWPTPAPITYGTALSSLQLNATSAVAGTFSYSPPAETVLGAGSQTLSVTFTPTYPTAYSTVSATVTITVTQGSQAISGFTLPAQVAYAPPMAPIPLTATGGGSGNPVTFTVHAGPGTIACTPKCALTITGLGTVTVYANQAGSADYTAAPQVSQSVVVSTYLAPAISGLGASSVSNTSETLSATINPENASTAYFFSYGLSPTTLTSTTAPKVLAAGVTGDAVSATVTGLQANTIYYYKLTAKSLGGQIVTPTLSFTTP